MSTECDHRLFTHASMRNTDNESDAEIDVDTESVAVDECVDSVAWDAFKPDSGCEAALKHARRCWLSTGTKVATAEEHRISSQFLCYECWEVGRDFGAAKSEPHRRPLVCSLADGGCR